MREEGDMEDSEARAVFRYGLYLISYKAPEIIEFPRNANYYTDMRGNYALCIA